MQLQELDGLNGIRVEGRCQLCVLCCLPFIHAVVPAGSYLKNPGQVAICPKGEWKAGTTAAGNCTKCAMGVTTQKEGATSAKECAGNNGILLCCRVCLSSAVPF